MSHDLTMTKKEGVTKTGTKFRPEGCSYNF
jgi:hypothetical protein